MTEHQSTPDARAHESERTNETSPRRQPKIWIGSLADYNDGRLHGEWIDAAQDEEELLEAAHQILATSEVPGAEEFAIFDYDDFGDFKVNEYEQLSVVAKIAKGIEEHGDAYAAWAELHDGDPDMLDAFEDSYLGEYDSAEAWAESIADDQGIDRQIEQTFGDNLARYIRFDAEQFARDAWLGDDVHVLYKDGGGCWIFNNA